MARQRSLYEILEAHELSLKQVTATLARVSAAGVASLDDLSDVTLTGDAARHVLLSDGAALYENRLLVEADISDLQTYTLPADLAAYLPLAGGTMTGALLADSGTAALPGVSFDADATMGMWYEAAATIGMTVDAGVSGVQLDASYFRSHQVATAHTPAILLGGGSVSTPTYSFNGDLDVGMWRSGTNELQFVTAGVERLTLTATTAEFGGAQAGDALINLTPSSSLPAYSFVNDLDTGMWRSAADEIRIGTGGTARVEINNLGLNVGGGNTGDPRLYITPTVSLPAFSFEGDTDTGIYRKASDQIGFAVGGVMGAHLTSNGFMLGDGGTTGQLRLESAAGSQTAPPFTFASDQNTGIYRAAADNMGLTAGGVVGLTINASYGSRVGINRFLTNVGNVETLRASRTASNGIVQVGYYSSNAADKKNIRQVAKGSMWQREWFMDLEPVSFERKTSDHFKQMAEDIPGYLPQEIGFTIENISKHTNMLTTQGNQQGHSIDEAALISVTVDYVQHLERRLAELEKRLA